MTAVYGILAAGQTPAQIIDERRQYDRVRLRAILAGDPPPPEEPLPRLPWALEELVGSAWVNLWAGFRERVLSVATDRWGDPALITRDVGDGFSSWRLGTWRRELGQGVGGYCIDCWVRVDLLSADEQLLWWVRRCDCERDQIASLERQIAKLQAHRDHSKYSTDAANINMWTRDRKRHTEELTHALAEVERFAAEHHLELPENFHQSQAQKTVHVGETTMIQSALW